MTLLIMLCYVITSVHGPCSPYCVGLCCVGSVASLLHAAVNRGKGQTITSVDPSSRGSLTLINHLFTAFNYITCCVLYNYFTSAM